MKHRDTPTKIQLIRLYIQTRSITAKAIQVLSRHESQRNSSSRTPCVKVTAWRTEAAGFISGPCSLEVDNPTASVNS